MESDDAPRCCRDSTQFFIFFVRLQALDSFGSASNAIACLYLSSKASPLFIASPLNSEPPNPLDSPRGTLPARLPTPGARRAARRGAQRTGRLQALRAERPSQRCGGGPAGDGPVPPASHGIRRGPRPRRARAVARWRGEWLRGRSARGGTRGRARTRAAAAS